MKLLLSVARWRFILHYEWNFQIVELTDLYNGAKFCITALQGDSMVGHHIGPNQMNPDRSSRLNLSANGSDGLTDYWRFLSRIWLDKSSILSFLKCMDGSLLAFLRCMDGFVWTYLNGTYGFVWSHFRFPTQSDPTRFPRTGISGVPQPLCKKGNTTFYLKKNSWNEGPLNRNV